MANKYITPSKHNTVAYKQKENLCTCRDEGEAETLT